MGSIDFLHEHMLREDISGKRLMKFVRSLNLKIVVSDDCAGKAKPRWRIAVIALM